MRAVYKEYFDVRDPSGKLRFQSLNVDDATSYATKYFERSAKKDNGIGTICAIIRKEIKKA